MSSWKERGTKREGDQEEVNGRKERSRKGREERRRRRRKGGTEEKKRYQLQVQSL